MRERFCIGCDVYVGGRKLPRPQCEAKTTADTGRPLNSRRSYWYSRQMPVYGVLCQLSRKIHKWEMWCAGEKKRDKVNLKRLQTSLKCLNDAISFSFKCCCSHRSQPNQCNVTSFNFFYVIASSKVLHNRVSLRLFKPPRKNKTTEIG